MNFQATRLRPAEWLLGAASAALLVDVFVPSWYAMAGGHGVNGWQALAVLRYLIVGCALVGLATWWVQATRRSPAIPVCLTVVTLFVSSILVLTLIWRVLIDPPTSGPGSGVDAGAYIGLFLAALVANASYRSLRVDGIRAADGPQQIERLSLDARPDADASLRS